MHIKLWVTSYSEKLLKSGIILELKEGLSLVEAQKFERLANIVDFSSSEKYLEKLQTIKESVKAKLKVAVKRILRKYGYPPDMQMLATETVLKQAELIANEIMI